MALTAKEVAKLIGVSQATLSLVVNNRPGISDRTRARVLQELRDRGLEYLLNQPDGQTGSAGQGKPDDAAKISAGHRTDAAGQNRGKTIGFVTFRVGGELLEYNSFLPLIMEHLEVRARKYGYALVFITINKADIRSSVQNIRLSGCSGFVLFATEMKESDACIFEELGIPFVLLDNYFNLHSLNAVKVNNEQGTHVAVDYLWKKGHRRIGYLKSGADINSFDERYENALKAIRSCGGENPEKYVFHVRYGIDESYEDMKKILAEKPELPTAFLSDNDLVAIGAMKAFRDMGYRVPEDVSFVGFDDRPVCVMSEPRLTSMRLPREYFGAEAVELLVRMLDGENQLLEKVEINTALVERESVAERK